MIRDHIGATPLANLQATLTADMLRIWEGLTKPQGLQGVRLGDYFDMEFIGLPHKVCLSFHYRIHSKDMHNSDVPRTDPRT